ncbi:beta-galactosidase 11-like [Humulus lupulus]|uniref:beta-galactosidase 11-like n=1 Tax=Humulus lupulus TaxID=3486 RepID=UPI002B40FB31|nr:beta-galactosidase 11-like [Humulus lupulus]
MTNICCAREFIVGDAAGWTTSFDYQTWAHDNSFEIGDTLGLGAGLDGGWGFSGLGSTAQGLGRGLGSTAGGGSRVWARRRRGWAEGWALLSLHEHKPISAQDLFHFQINTCNGRHCGDTFTGPNKPNKPSIWTAQYRVFGDPPSQRAAEDIAYLVARFFSKNGTLNNYYMYHGGTNFGRTSAVFTTTRYYDEAPLDEYGLQREPKWSHLRDLHKALNLCKKALLWGTPGVQRLGKHTEVRLYEKHGTSICDAFLTNNSTKGAHTVKFRGDIFYLPPRSISILPDCKNVVYNTQIIVSQHNARNYVRVKETKNLKWKMSPEPIPNVHQMNISNKIPNELYGMLKDTTDYGWYTTSIELSRHDLPMRPDILPVIRVASLGHALHSFVNGEYIGSAHGSHEEKGFVFQKAITLKPGTNHIALLGMTVGLPDSGAYMEHRYAGPRAVTILGLNTGTIDLTQNGWRHQVGLTGEMNHVFADKGTKKVEWTQVKEEGPALTWYKVKSSNLSNLDSKNSYIYTHMHIFILIFQIGMVLVFFLINLTLFACKCVFGGLSLFLLSSDYRFRFVK